MLDTGSGDRRPPVILQRLSRHVRKTDWWAVLIELAVVVLGILIAFELNEWNERRQDRAAERQVLQHLAEEAEGDVLALTAIRDGHRRSVENYRALILAVRDSARAARYNAERAGDGCNLLRIPAIKRASAGSGGLGSPERLQVITDVRLRDLLRRAEAARTFADSQVSYFRSTFVRYYGLVEPYTRWTLTSSRDATCSVDVDRLARDPLAVYTLPKIGRDQQALAEFREGEIKATQAVLDRVQCLRNATCKPENAVTRARRS